MPLSDLANLTPQQQAVVRGIAALRQRGWQDSEIFAMPTDQVMAYGLGQAAPDRFAANYKMAQLNNQVGTLQANYNDARAKDAIAMYQEALKTVANPYNVVAANALQGPEGLANPLLTSTLGNTSAVQPASDALAFYRNWMQDYLSHPATDPAQLANARAHGLDLDAIDRMNRAYQQDPVAAQTFFSQNPADLQRMFGPGGPDAPPAGAAAGGPLIVPRGAYFDDRGKPVFTAGENGPEEVDIAPLPGISQKLSPGEVQKVAAKTAKAVQGRAAGTGPKVRLAGVKGAGKAGGFKGYAAGAAPPPIGAPPRQPVGIGFPIAHGPGTPISGSPQPWAVPPAPVGTGFPVATGPGAPVGGSPQPVPRPYGSSPVEPGLGYVLAHYRQVVGGHRYNMLDLSRLAGEGFLPQPPVGMAPPGPTGPQQPIGRMPQPLTLARPAPAPQPVGVGYPIATGPETPIGGAPQPRPVPPQPYGTGFPVARGPGTPIGGRSQPLVPSPQTPVPSYGLGAYAGYGRPARGYAGEFEGGYAAGTYGDPSTSYMNAFAQGAGMYGPPVSGSVLPGRSAYNRGLMGYAGGTPDDLASQLQAIAASPNRQYLQENAAAINAGTASEFGPNNAITINGQTYQPNPGESADAFRARMAPVYAETQTDKLRQQYGTSAVRWVPGIGGVTTSPPPSYGPGPLNAAEQATVAQNPYGLPNMWPKDWGAHPGGNPTGNYGLGATSSAGTPAAGTGAGASGATAAGTGAYTAEQQAAAKQLATVLAGNQTVDPGFTAALASGQVPGLSRMTAWTWNRLTPAQRDQLAGLWMSTGQVASRKDIDAAFESVTPPEMVSRYKYGDTSVF